MRRKARSFFAEELSNITPCVRAKMYQQKWPSAQVNVELQRKIFDELCHGRAWLRADASMWTRERLRLTSGSLHVHDNYPRGPRLCTRGQSKTLPKVDGREPVSSTFGIVPFTLVLIRQVWHGGRACFRAEASMCTRERLRSTSGSFRSSAVMLASRGGQASACRVQTM